MNLGSDRIDEERVCIDSLVQYLKGLDANSCVEAQEERDDPPDYWLTVGEQRFAVEITSIVYDQGYAALCNALHDSIKRQCESDSPVPGEYAVSIFRRPHIPKRETREWKKLVEDTVAKIRGLSGSAPGSEVQLLHNASGTITISKCSAEGSTVVKFRTPEPKRDVEAQQELSHLLEQAISKKLNKLQNKGVTAKCRDVILLLYDAYEFSSVETAKRALSNVKGYDWLHSIFWAASFSDRANVMYPDSPGRAGCFLYSMNEVWRQRAF
jgi:hypothetical protein